MIDEVTELHRISLICMGTLITSLITYSTGTMWVQIRTTWIMWEAGSEVPHIWTHTVFFYLHTYDWWKREVIYEKHVLYFNSSLMLAATTILRNYFLRSAWDMSQDFLLHWWTQAGCHSETFVTTIRRNGITFWWITLFILKTSHVFILLRCCLH